jgi:hypothetical protein
MIPPNWAQHLHEAFPDQWVHRAVMNSILQRYRDRVHITDEHLAREKGAYVICPDSRVADVYLMCTETGKSLRWGDRGWVILEAHIYNIPIIGEIIV